MSERIAIISDVHANLTALEAVLDYLQDAGVSRIFNLGDLVGKGPRPAAVVDRCREICEVTVQGNWDDLVVTDPDPVAQWNRDALGAERLAYLGELPGAFDFLLSGRQVRLFHASQVSPHHRVQASATADEHQAMFENTDFTGRSASPDLVGYGDVHEAFQRIYGGRLLFNAGSVGNPLDMPLASLAIIEGRFGDPNPAPWALHFVRVPYDIEAEIAVADASGMPEPEAYAKELRTGRYRRLG